VVFADLPAFSLYPVRGPAPHRDSSPWLSQFRQPRGLSAAVLYRSQHHRHGRGSVATGRVSTAGPAVVGMRFVSMECRRIEESANSASRA
ncbi:MAG: hypothetical protein ACK48U_02305, partial [Planctomyces sp.]